MITFIVRQGPTPPVTPDRLKNSRPVPDIAATHWNGQPYEASSTHSATMKLARLLVAEGCPDQPWEARGTDGQRRYFGKSLHRWAELTLTESPETGRVAITRWRAISHYTGYSSKAVQPSAAASDTP
jgi:hypothetical protein